MTVSSNYLLPTLPEGLEGLAELALDLRWSWNHAADRLWKNMDPELWSMTTNPWLMLQTMKSRDIFLDDIIYQIHQVFSFWI